MHQLLADGPEIKLLAMLGGHLPMRMHGTIYLLNRIIKHPNGTSKHLQAELKHKLMLGVLPLQMIKLRNNLIGTLHLHKLTRQVAGVNKIHLQLMSNQ